MAQKNINNQNRYDRGVLGTSEESGRRDSGVFDTMGLSDHEALGSGDPLSSLDSATRKCYAWSIIMVKSLIFTKAKATTFGGGSVKAVPSGFLLWWLLQHRKPPLGALPTNHRLCHLLAILLLIFFTTGPSIATQEQDDSALLDELDEVELIEEEAGQGSLFERFIDHFQGKQVLRYDFFLEEMGVPESPPFEPDTQRHIFGYRNEFETFVSDEWLRFSLAGWIGFDNQKDAYRSRLTEIEEWSWEDIFQDRSYKRNFLQISELYLGFFTPILDIALGKKILVNSLSSLYSPADLYYAKDLYDPLDEGKIGKLLVQLDLKLGDQALTGVIFPVYQGDKINPGSRWSYDGVFDALNRNQLLYSEEDYPDISLENMSYFLRLKGPVLGVDYLISLFHGIDEAAVSKVTGPLPFDKELDVVPVFQAAHGLATTIGKLELHTEALFNYAYEARDDDYLRYVGGFIFTIDDWLVGTFLDKIELTAEYAGEWLIQEQSHSDYTDSTEMRHLHKNDILQRIFVQMGEKLSVEIVVQYELNHIGFIFGSAVAYTPLPDLELEVDFQIFRPPDGSEYYDWRDNTRIFTVVTYSY